ncbi:ankyrin repeat and LEM domain-containing protein 2-like [Artemia franciscana]|uniref:Ankyrin repeat and LEM domain-containing protein 2 n=1 Tax=Artemia franciscana TaxID=6661 RepID=A0AA88L163_ARTSF|nr:hypothetical protein QYM36_009899 [Artemia franciscana]
MPEFHGIAYPSDCIQLLKDKDSPVFVTESKKEALDICKKFKGSRFKTFPTLKEAEQFSQLGQDILDGVSKPAASGEKPSLFKSPTPQDIVKLRKAAEAGDTDYFVKCVWENPRYLISSGDTPVTTGGQKYNMLHFICKANQHSVGKALLKTITDLEFLKLYYPEEEEDGILQKRQRLLDYYLNTSDKTSHETPLHVASKFGSLECVDLLCSYIETDTKKLNKDGSTALEILCSRARADTPADVKKKMQKLLSERFYIPIIVSDDLTEQRGVGDLWSPDAAVCDKPSPLPTVLARSAVNKIPGITPLASPTGPYDEALSRTNVQSPLRSGGLKVVGYAGPTDRETAEILHKEWKTPPRVVSNRLLSDTLSTPVRRGSDPTRDSTDSVYSQSPQQFDGLLHHSTPVRQDYRGRSFSCLTPRNGLDPSSRITVLSENRLKDPERGLQAYGLELCSKRGVPFIEYWPFLNEYVNIRCEDGLDKLNEHLKRKRIESYKKRLDHKVLLEKLEKLSKEKDDEGNLDYNDNNDSAISDLCNRLGDMRLTSPMSPKDTAELPINSDSEIDEQISSLEGHVQKIFEIIMRNNHTDENDEGLVNLFNLVSEQFLRLSLEAKEHLKFSIIQIISQLGGNSISIKDKFLQEWSRLEPRHDGSGFKAFIESTQFGVSNTPESQTGHLGLVRHRLGFRNGHCSLPRSLFGERDENEKEEEDVFITPRSSPTSAVTPEEETDVFIQGDEPSKADFDVFQVLNGIPIDNKKYPYLFIWNHCLSQLVPTHDMFGSPSLRRPIASSLPPSPVSEPVGRFRNVARKLPMGISPLAKHP